MTIEYIGPDRPGWENGKRYNVNVQNYVRSEKIMAWQISNSGSYRDAEHHLINFENKAAMDKSFKRVDS